MEKVSIIIPMHNEEKYIKRLIPDIKNQTYKNIEIIVVDDASTDSSLSVLNSLTDDRFVVLKNETCLGVSAARNKGLLAATGKYLFFVDMDDMVKPEMVEQLVFCIEENKVQLAVSGYERFNEEGIITGSHLDERTFKTGVISAYEFVRDMIRQEGIKSSLWNKLYIRELTKGLSFRTDIQIGEDLLFNMDYASRIYSAAVFGEPLYRYFENPAGAMKKIYTATSFDENWLTEWRVFDEYAKAIRKWPELDVEAGKLIFYRRLIIAHKLYYKMAELGVLDRYPKEVKAMKKVLFESDRLIIANKFINPKWKTKLLLKKR